jgi:soluble lytic murein transglycosylase-like protein
MRIRYQIVFWMLCLASATAVATDVATLSNGFEVQHERREQRADITRLYLYAGTDSGYVEVATKDIVQIENADLPQPAASKAPPASSQPVYELVNAASERHRVDPDLIASVIHAESNFNPLARSPKGAQGLMQLMPKTASRLGVNDPFEPAENIDGGAQYLRELLLRYNGDIVKALAAYNAGPQRVARYGGVPPYRETRAFIARVVKDFNRRKKKTGFRAGPTKPASPPTLGSMAPRVPGDS